MANVSAGELRVPPAAEAPAPPDFPTCAGGGDEPPEKKARTGLMLMQRMPSVKSVASAGSRMVKTLTRPSTHKPDETGVCMQRCVKPSS
jgi:hypothetical protein